MSYDAIEAAIKTILLYDTTTFPALVAPDTISQVTRGDWRIMDSGKSPLVVLYAGGYTEDESQIAALNEFAVTWTAKLDLIVKYTDDGATRTTLAQKRDVILQDIMQYPMLHGLASATARLGKITSDGDPVPIFDKNGGGPFFLMQTFSIPVSEVLAIAPLG